MRLWNAFMKKGDAFMKILEKHAFMKENMRLWRMRLWKKKRTPAGPQEGGGVGAVPLAVGEYAVVGEETVSNI